MKPLPFLDSNSVLIDIGQSSLKAVDGERTFELPVERLENGRLSEHCQEQLVERLGGFFGKGAAGKHAFCAIGARGISLRRLSLPPCANEEVPRLLALQIEKEFPLPPEELSWGSQRLNSHHAANSQESHDFLVAALKKEVLEEYAGILSKCGLRPFFTPGVLARRALCPQRSGSFAVLDVGRHHSEVVTFENGVPLGVRLLGWGGENLTRSIGDRLGLARDEAERIKIGWNGAASSDTERLPAIRGAVQDAVASLASSVRNHWTGPTLYLTGKTARFQEFTERFAEALGTSVECRPLEVGASSSAAILGLQQSARQNGPYAPLLFQVSKPKGRDEDLARPSPWKWAAVAAALAVLALGLRYAEAYLRKPALARSLAEVRAAQAKLPDISRELAFLQYLETNQPPYIGALSILADSSGRGTRLETLSINRRGDVSLRGTMQGAQQATDFRSKLIASGLFPLVTVDEQTPTPDRDKVNVRISARWKAFKDERWKTELQAGELASQDPPPSKGAKATNSAAPFKQP